MIDTLEIFNELSKNLDPEAARKIAEVMGKMYRDLSNIVTKQEFKELTEVVRELAGAQKKSEQRLEKLETIVQELAKAQRKTEERLNELAEAQRKTEQRLNELTEAQKESEQRISKLEITMQELAEAQRKTEQRLERLEIIVQKLAEAQRKTEQRLDELAEAQKETERAITRLTRGLEITRDQVGGLSRSVGYALENEAYRNLPSILKSRYNIKVVDRLIRTYISDVEINVFGKARQNGKEVYLVGEAVLKLDDRSKLKLVWDKVNVVREEFGGEVIPIIVTHFARPDVLERAQRAGIIVIQSFEWV